MQPFVSTGLVGRRWLLPLIAPLFALVAIVGQAVTAWAAAGPTGSITCCCPDPAACKCHDHDDQPQPSQLKRCAGDAKLVAPSVLPAVATAAVDVAPVVRAIAVAPPRLSRPTDARLREPETPPF